MDAGLRYMSDTKLLLTGANGRTGRAILSAMAARGIAVRAFVRSPANKADMEALGAHEVAFGDFMDAASIDAAVKGVTKILHIGPPMHPEEVAISQRFISAGQKHAIDQFIYYSVMHPVRTDVRHHKFKLHVEEALIGSGLPYTILQPSRYMQHLVPIWPNVLSSGVHAMPFNTQQAFSVADLKDLAEACAVVAASDQHLYATYELAGPQALSQTDMAQIISSALGKPVRAEAVPYDVMEAKARAAGANDDRVSQMLTMNKHYDAHGFRGNANVLEYLLQRPATRFDAYVKTLIETSP